MGFRTLALQKRSSEVWKVLGSVKKEFENWVGPNTQIDDICVFGMKV